MMIKVKMKYFPLQRDWVWLYCLDSVTLGISKELVPDWRKISLYVTKIRVQVSRGSYLIKIPKRVTRFYRYDKNTKEVAGIGTDGTILITLSR